MLFNLIVKTYSTIELYHTTPKLNKIPYLSQLNDVADWCPMNFFIPQL